MKFNLRQLLAMAILVGMLVSMVTNASRVDKDQTYALITFSPDGNKIAVQGSISTQVFDVHSGRRLAEFDSYSAELPEHIEFVDDQTVLSFGFSQAELGPRKVRWHSLKTKQIERELKITHLHEHFSPAADGFLHTNNVTQTLLYYSRDPRQADPLLTASYTQLPDWLALKHHVYHQRSARHAYLNATAADLRDLPGSKLARVTLLDALPGKAIKLSDLEGNVRFSPQHNWLANETDEGIEIFDVTTGNRTWSSAGEFSRTRFSHNEQFVGVDCAGDANNEVHVWEVESGKLLLMRESQRDYMGTPFAVSNQGLAAVATTDNSRNGIEIWDIRKNQLLRSVGMTNAKDKRRRSSIFSFLLLFAWCILWSCMMADEQHHHTFKVTALGVCMAVGLALMALGHTIIWKQDFLGFLGGTEKIIVAMMPLILGIVVTTLSLRAWKAKIFGSQSDDHKHIDAESDEPER